MRLFRRFGVWGLGFAVFLLACSSTPVPALTPASLPLIATDLAAPLVRDLAAAYSADHPDVVPALAVAAQAALADELAASRAALAFTASTAPDQFATPIGYVRFVMIAHPGNPATALSLAQTRALLAGQIMDWAQIGGNPGAVQIVSREDGSDGALAFASAASAASGDLTPNAVIAPTWEAMRALVGREPGAFGYLPAPELDPAVKTLSVDAELRALIVAVALAEPTGEARDFLVWVQSEAGQAVVGQRYEKLQPDP